MSPPKKSGDILLLLRFFVIFFFFFHLILSALVLSNRKSQLPNIWQEAGCQCLDVQETPIFFKMEPVAMETWNLRKIGENIKFQFSQ